jgi:CRP/FNR family transcriptional regulator
MASVVESGKQVACAVCAMEPLCHSRAVANGVPSPIESHRRIPAGEAFYKAGTPRNAIYALRAGMAQVSVEDGRNGTHIVRFLLPGDTAGLDAFAGGVHHNQAVSVEDCDVCILPADRLGVPGRFNEATSEQLRNLLSRELAETEAHSVMLSRLTAMQRVARFLLDLSRRWSERGYSATYFRLPMGRRAIGAHLALTTETVSRILSDFQAKGWIDLPWREVRILEPDKLTEVLANP